MEYPKIKSLYKRAQYVTGAPKGSHGQLILGDYADQIFGNILKWHVTEKIDGTNIRIFYMYGSVSIAGRTKDAQLPPHLLRYLQTHFTPELMISCFPVADEASYPEVVLFGEGYGPKIQSCGGNYRSDPGFVLFDAVVGKWWLEPESVAEIAHKLGVPYAPVLGVMSENEIVELVKSKPLSLCSRHPQTMEGVVCRSSPIVLFRTAHPVMWKLKCKDLSE